jgi:D-alanyl-D-alanine carboxypeptidase
MKIIIIIISISSILYIIWYLAIKYITRPNNIAKLISEHSKDIAMIYEKNGVRLINKNINKQFPLASMIKIIIAIEYSEKVLENRINADSLISIELISRYFLRGTDGGAHERWLKDAKEQNFLINNKVSIKNIVEGMIKYSSNANTEFLIDLLTINNLNIQLQKLGLEHHGKFRYITSSMLITDESIFNDINKLELESQIIHNKLLNKEYTQNELNNLIAKSNQNQKKWSENFISSTAYEYYSVIKKINDDKLNPLIKEILEWPTKSLTFNNKIKVLGAKGGSTAFILTYSTYVKYIDNQNAELVFMCNNEMDEAYFPLFKKGFNNFLLELLSNDKQSLTLTKIINNEDIK